MKTKTRRLTKRKRAVSCNSCNGFGMILRKMETPELDIWSTCGRCAGEGEHAP